MEKFRHKPSAIRLVTQQVRTELGLLKLGSDKHYSWNCRPTAFKILLFPSFLFLFWTARQKFIPFCRNPRLKVAYKEFNILKNIR